MFFPLKSDIFFRLMSILLPMMYYLHGYKSTPTSAKAQLFQKKLHAIPIHYRTVKPDDISVEDCIKIISSTIKNDPETVLIGSSFGGFLAAKMALHNPNISHLILLNPAVIPPYVNAEEIHDVSSSVLAQMIDAELFHKKIGSPIVIFCATNDDVIPQRWIIEFAQIQEAAVYFFHDDHRFSQTMEKLPKIITSILR